MTPTTRALWLGGCFIPLDASTHLAQMSMLADPMGIRTLSVVSP